MHDIGELFNLVPASLKVPLTTEEQGQLTFYATTANYPGDYEPVSREEDEAMVSAGDGHARRLLRVVYRDGSWSPVTERLRKDWRQTFERKERAAHHFALAMGALIS